MNLMDGTTSQRKEVPTMSKLALLQELCRKYLRMLLPIAKNIGLEDFINTTIEKNEKGECIATKEQVDLLAKMCDDDRIRRDEIPQYAGISYGSCVLIDLFSKIRKFTHKGVYSKIDAMLFKEEQSEGKEAINE